MVPAQAGASAAVPAIRFDRVSKTFPARGRHDAVTALQDISLDVAPGQIFGVIGRSGAGKSTLLRVINGLEKPTAGRVLVDGTDVGALGEAELRAQRRRIGMIFQHFNLLSSRTVFDNVALPLELAGAKRDAIVRRVDKLLDMVGLADKRGRYPAELSGGQKQRVGIARALATEPRVLLSDEATSALDPETTRSILDLLRRVNALTGVTIVLITHEMQVIKAICDSVAVIEDGRIIEQGPVYDLFAQPRTATARSFVASVAGSAIPAGLAERLSPRPVEGSRAVLRVVLSGPQATAPIISELARTQGIDVQILSGQIDRIGEVAFGTLVLSVPADPAVVAAALGLVRGHGLEGEVAGYVA
ncbi:methionine ABC transporter ATP-binding protein [Rhodovastum atsumiense]|uniref:Cell division ATP-binding protein FtsE n=2 Tax=Rhodovastum atsumiense TaxID=504468 RepID=A0A5M6IVT7_9PROT|nr:methionine ABC transporter ATP-binding protein [Rhodovastum atsumiense]